MDVDAAVQKALATQSAEFAKQLKELTGHDDLKAFQEAQFKSQNRVQELYDAEKAASLQLKAKYEQAQIGNALLAAAGDAVDSETVLALLGGKAEVGADGAVKIGGKPAAEAVKELLEKKPFLAKPAGGAGGGAPANGGGGAAKNPWSKDSFNLTEQARLFRENPQEAARLRAAAGL